MFYSNRQPMLLIACMNCVVGTGCLSTSDPWEAYTRRAEGPLGVVHAYSKDGGTVGVPLDDGCRAITIGNLSTDYIVDGAPAEIVAFTQINSSLKEDDRSECVLLLRCFNKAFTPVSAVQFGCDDWSERVVFVAAFDNSIGADDPLEFFKQSSAIYRGRILPANASDQIDMAIQVQAGKSHTFLGSPVAITSDNNGYKVLGVVVSSHYSEENEWLLHAVSIPSEWRDAFRVYDPRVEMDR